MRRIAAAVLASCLAGAAGCGLLFDGDSFLGGAEGGGPDASDGVAATDGGASADAGADVDVACDADLTSDPKHCGRCGRDCGGSSCQGGMCLPVAIAAPLQEAWYLDIDETAGIFVGEHRDNGRILRVPFGGLPAEDLGNVLGAFDLAASSAGVLFTGGSRSSLLRHLALDGGSITTVADAGAGAGTLEVERDGRDIFMTARAGDTAPSPRGRLFRITDDDVSLFASGEFLEGLYLESDTVYVLERSEGVRVYARANGTLLRVLPVGTSTPRRLTGDAEHLYVISFDDVRIVRLNKATGAVKTVGEDTAGGSHGSIVVDDAWVYWTSPDTGTIKRAPKDGAGPTEVIAAGIPRPIGLVQDAKFLYFAAYGAVGETSAYVGRLAK